jgi:hypothetical protein
MVAEIPLGGFCYGLAFSKDGRTLVTSLANVNLSGGHIILWQVPDGTKLDSYPSEAGATGPSIGFAATPDLGLAAYAYGSAYPQKVCVVDLRDGKELWTAVASPDWILALALAVSTNQSCG